MEPTKPDSENTLLIPHFSIRWILALTGVAGMLAVVVRQAYLQKIWAIAFTAIMALVAGIFLAYGATFVLAYFLAKATRSLNRAAKPSNPFVVEGQYPPQMIPKNTFGGEQE